MRLRNSIPFARLLIMLALTLSLIGSAWAHRGNSVTESDDLAAFVAAGGSLDDLCLPETEKRHGATQTCDACRLVDSVSLAGVGLSAPVVLAGVDRALGPGAHFILPLSLAHYTHGARAPPVQL